MIGIDTESREIWLHRGDTGTITYRFGGWQLLAGDIVVFTMRTPQGTVALERYLEPEDNCVDVVFRNPDTDSLASGAYSYDLRVVHAPKYDDDGAIVDGAFIRTPMDPTAVHLNDTVGRV